MKEDRKIEQLIALGIKEITIEKSKYDKLKEETRKLIKLNDVKIKIVIDKKEWNRCQKKKKKQ